MKTGSPEYEYAMFRAAELYYADGLLQSEVADKLRLSRWKVGRLLEDARETGLVEITIHHPTSRRRDLEAALRDRFDRDAIVVPSQPNYDATMKAVAQATASYMTELRPQPATIAMCWGRTLAAVAEALPHEAFVEPTIVQMNGGTNTTDGTVAAGHIMRTVASKSVRPVTRLLPVPAVVDDAGLARRLRADRAVRATLDLASHADVAVFALGKLNDESILVQSGAVRDSERENLLANGTVGDLLGHYINADGQIVNPELDSRTIAVEVDKLPKQSIAVAAGVEKAPVIAAALKAKLCSVIITDSEAAETVLTQE